MARMMPPLPDADNPSTAEVRVFHALAAQLPDDWVVLHSLGLTTHDRKLWAEADFVLIGPSGVYVLEIKGGRVARRGGAWEFGPEGTANVKKESPWEQAQGAAAALRTYLRREDRSLSRIIVGAAVVLPDIDCPQPGPDLTVDITLDRPGYSRGFMPFVKSISSYWTAEYLAKYKRQPEGLEASTVTKIVNLLRADFDLQPSLAVQAERIEESLIRFTAQQSEYLAVCGSTEKILVLGGAGTGKTTLAIHEALRQAREGKRVFLCCFNEMLGTMLRAATEGEPLVMAGHLHGLMKSTIADLGHPGCSGAPESLSACFVEAVLESGTAGAFDVLVVDEAQDLLSDEYADVFDAILNRELDGGWWRFFGDENQSIFNPDSGRVIRLLRRQHPAIILLTKNCRSTQPIADYTSMLSGLPPAEAYVHVGPDVERLWYRDEPDAARKTARAINRLLSQGVTVDDIVILSPRKFESSCARLLEGQGLTIPVVDRKARGSSPPGSHILYSTIQAFKGMESKFVVVADLDDLNAPYMASLVYVGLSRARAGLVLVLSENQRDSYEAKEGAYATRAATLLRHVN